MEAFAADLTRRVCAASFAALVAAVRAWPAPTFKDEQAEEAEVELEIREAGVAVVVPRVAGPQGIAAARVAVTLVHDGTVEDEREHVDTAT